MVTLEKNADFMSIVMSGGSENYVTAVQTKTVKVGVCINMRLEQVINVIV